MRRECDRQAARLRRIERVARDNRSEMLHKMRRMSGRCVCHCPLDSSNSSPLTLSRLPSLLSRAVSLLGVDCDVRTAVGRVSMVVWCAICVHADSFPVGWLLSHCSVSDDVAFVEADGNARGLSGTELGGLRHRGRGSKEGDGTRDNECTVVRRGRLTHTVYGQQAC